MATPLTTLVTNRYSKPGTVIGQILKPAPTNLNGNIRIPCFIGRGSRLAIGENIAIRRSFIYAEPLNFPPTAPFAAMLQHSSNGIQAAPVRVYRNDGLELLSDKWKFQKVDGNYVQVLINSESYDQTKQYYIDYQSVDRTVLDPLPSVFQDIRQIRYVGTAEGQSQYKEFEDYFVETSVSTVSPDELVFTQTPSLGTVVSHALQARQNIVTIACTDAAILDGKYFTVVDAAGTVAVWFNVSGTTPEPTHTADRSIAITTVSASSSAIDVASAVIAMLNGDPAFIIEAMSDATMLRVLDATTGYRGTSSANDSGFIVTLVQAGNTTSTGTAAVTVGSEYEHQYTRTYTMTCVSISGTAPNRQATFTWEAENRTAGNELARPVPLAAAEPKPTFTLIEGTASLQQDLEFGVSVTFAFGASGSFVPGDVFKIDGYGPSLVEPDARYNNKNQFSMLSEIAAVKDPISTGVVTKADNLNYTGKYNANFVIKCIATSGLAPTRQATFVWNQRGYSSNSGTFLVREDLPISQQVSIGSGLVFDFSFGTANFAANDEFTFTALAPRIFFTGKDNRNVAITVGAAVASNANQGALSGTYLADTVEGGFGQFTTSSTSDYQFDGVIPMPDNLVLYARNLIGGAQTHNPYRSEDKFYFSTSNSNSVDWSPVSRSEREYESSDIYRDLLGTITGVPNSYYIVLPTVPMQGTVVVRNAQTQVLITSGEIVGTSYVSFLANPDTRIHVSYEHKGDEPEPGTLYYITAYYVRPTSQYNAPIRVNSREEGRRLLQPILADNHLAVMNEIAWDHGVFAAYFVQVFDTDGDGIYTNTDFKSAVFSTEAVKDITDRVVLANYGSLPDQLSVNLKANDPYEARESLDWFGMPIGTPIGADDVPNTLAAMARRTLQVYGASPAHGTRILHAATYCKRTVLLDSGTQQQLTLDGSFVAGALCSRACGITSLDPADTVLRKTILGFDEIQTYSEPENLVLGEKQLITFLNLGGGVYRIEEDVTVDSYAEEFQIISAMTQKQNVTRIVRNGVDTSVIATVVPSAEAGAEILRGVVSGILQTLLSRGVIAPYQNEDGAERTFDPQNDVIAYREKGSKTTFRFAYSYYLRYPIKRATGLFLVDSNDFGVQ